LLVVFAVVKVKESPKVQFISCGTSGNRVMAQRFQILHPPPQDDGVDLWELSRTRERNLRFADEDQFSPSYDHEDYQSSISAEHDLEPRVDQNEDVFVDLSPSAVYIGLFGQYEEVSSGRPGAFRSPTSIDCARDGRLVVVDADSGSVQLFARNGDHLSGFRVIGARAACFISDAARGESLAVATSSGVSICDQTGRVEKHLPVGTDLVAVAAVRHGGGVFVAAHRDRLTICDRYKPTAVFRSVSSVKPLNAYIGQPGIQFADIVALATTATPRLYLIDTAAGVLAIDVDTGTVLQSITPAETRLLRQPSAVTVDLVTGSVLVCDAAARRVMQFDAEVDGGRQRCLVQLDDDAGRCVAMTTGARGPDGHQLIYVVCRGQRSAQVRMYQI